MLKLSLRLGLVPGSVAKPAETQKVKNRNAFFKLLEQRKTSYSPCSWLFLCLGVRTYTYARVELG